MAADSIDLRLDGKVAIVTGGGSGIGRATARLFAVQGANVVLVDRNSDTGEGVAKEIREQGGSAEFILTDVSEAEQVRRMVEGTMAIFHRIDIMVNNAGISGEGGPFWEISETGWEQLLRVNLTGQFLCAKYAVPHMIAQGGGVIVNMTSVLGLAAFENVCAYITSKAGIAGMTRAMAIDLARKNVRVNCVAPGTIDTPMMWEPFQPEDYERIMEEAAESVPVGRVAGPEEIATAVLFLCSPGASLITGTTLVADGGLLARISTDI